jgi:hypothetical protein
VHWAPAFVGWLERNETPRDIAREGWVSQEAIPISCSLAKMKMMGFTKGLYEAFGVKGYFGGV